MAAFQKDLHVGTDSLPNTAKCQPHPLLTEATPSTSIGEKGQAKVILATQRHAARGHWSGFSCHFPGRRCFRGRARPLCSPDRAPARLPLQGQLRERIVLFMRWEGKIKLPCCFSFRMKRRKRVLLFLVAKASSPLFTFQGSKRRMAAGHQPLPVLGQGRLLAAGSPHPKQCSETWQPERGPSHTAVCPNPPSCESTLPFWGSSCKSMRRFVSGKKTKCLLDPK